MILRRAHCDHWIPEDVAPVGVPVGSEQPVYLCAQCEQLARSHLKPKVEVKRVTPEEFAARVFQSAYERGRSAATDGIPEDDVPFADRRTKDAKEWLRGHRDQAGGN